MKRVRRMLFLFAAVALVAACWGSPTGPEPEPKTDTDGGTEKQEVIARAAPPAERTV